MVTGSLALALGEPLLGKTEGKLADILGDSVTDVSSQNPRVTIGKGRLNIEDFLQAAL